MASMNQAELNAALKALEQALNEGEAELKENPSQHQLVKQLSEELKKIKPGVAPPPKVMTMLQTFFTKALEEESKEQAALLAEAQKQPGLVALKVADAHTSVLNALSLAQKSVNTLSIATSAEAAAAGAAKATQANDEAAKKVTEAELALNAPAIKPLN